MDTAKMREDSFRLQQPMGATGAMGATGGTVAMDGKGGTDARGATGEPVMAVTGNRTVTAVTGNRTRACLHAPWVEATSEHQPNSSTATLIIGS